MTEYTWYKSYDPGVPHSLEPYPDVTLLDVVEKAAAERPGSPFLFFKGKQMSHAEIVRFCGVFAAALAANDVKKGDRVAILLPNCPQGIIAAFGAWKAGAVPVPLNPMYTESELTHCLKECGAEVAVVLTPFYTAVKNIQKRTNLRLIIAAGIKDYLPPFLSILFTLIKEKKEGHKIEVQPGDVMMADLMKKHNNDAAPAYQPVPDDIALLLFSGGTTGIPKGVITKHKHLIAEAWQLHTWNAPVLTKWEDRVMMLMPLFHVYGFAGVMGTSIMGHNPLVIIPNPRDRDDVVKTIQKTRPAYLPAVPTLFIALLEHPLVKAGKVDFKSMKLCVASAAPLLPETKKRFEDLTGGKLIEGYGMTELTAAVTLGLIEGKWKAGSAGLPLPDVILKIVDVETGKNEMPAGQEGEMVFRCPQMMEGYWNRPDATAEMIVDGWLHTGDIGLIDEDGYLFITSRKKDLIKPGGFQVWPREVEEVISAHPKVSEVGVAGIPDPYQTESVKAWVVLREGESATAEEMQAYCREKLTAYKVPKFVEFRSELPKTLVGKILKRILVEEEINRQKAAGGGQQ
ncbi:MAG: long-chain fatty acid--CoA ligase [Dehalococcoidia bacterium]|nr:long-chain fatty acid--CoA ligase [Dehalococcoidia bacterium]